MKFKVFIPTAGTGSRLYNETKNINKSLVLIDNKPIISHIIDKFSQKTEFVIALGYKGDLVRQYLKIAHPKNIFKFVIIKKYFGKGSGLGLTLLKSKNYLQAPFIFFSCDAYVAEKKIDKPTRNWVGYSKNFNPKIYRTIEIKNNKLKKIYNKNSSQGKYNYIGVAGIKDFKNFWKNFKKNKETINNGEVVGLENIKFDQIFTQEFNWHDCGNVESLRNLRESFVAKDKPIILPKEEEFIAFVSNNVIKFHLDKNFIKKRVLRQKNLKKFTPRIIKFSKNFYSYKKIKGTIFSKKNNKKNFFLLLKFLKELWKKKKLSKTQNIQFRKDCFNFYKKKTLKRLKEFYKKNSLVDKSIKINQIRVPSINNLFKKIDWKEISNGIPVNFHGDLHFENIIFNSKNISLLDWRQDFAGNIVFGDIYYDFAKLLHGMIVSHEIINNNNYKINIKNDNIVINITQIKNNLISKDLFFKWLHNNKYSVKKTKIICGLIYLNIAALHHYPYSIFLFYLGKLMIHKSLNDEEIFY